MFRFLGNVVKFIGCVFIFLFVLGCIVDFTSSDVNKNQNKVHQTSKIKGDMSKSKSTSDDDWLDDSSSDVDSSSEDDTTASSTSSSNDDNGPTKQQQAALNSANEYLDYQGFSEKGLFNQLTSESEGFSNEDAQYAIDNLKNVDWNKQALRTAEDYNSEGDMSTNSIYEQLVSDAEGFTPDQANYAVNNLSK